MRRKDEEGNEYIAEPFTYSVDFNALTGAWNTASSQIQIQADAAFVVLEQSYSFQEATAITTDENVQLIPNMFVLLTDGGSARKLMNQPVQLSTHFGNGKLPFILPVPKFFSASANILVQISADLSYGATVYDLQLNFIGEKRYYL